MSSRRFAALKIIRKQHREGLISDNALSTQNCMAQAQLLRLPNKNAFHPAWQDIVNHIRLLVFSLSAKRRLQLKISVKVVFNGALVAPRHEDQGINSRANSFLNRILDQRLINDRQQFLWHSLSGR